MKNTDCLRTEGSWVHEHKTPGSWNLEVIPEPVRVLDK
jgi:hypothetical protein